MLLEMFARDILKRTLELIITTTKKEGGWKTYTRNDFLKLVKRGLNDGFLTEEQAVEYAITAMKF